MPRLPSLRLRSEAVRALVIGGTGFISGALVARLAADGHAVTVFHRGERMLDVPNGVTRIVGDRTKIAQHADALRAVNAEVIFDCVAFTEDDARGVVEVFRGVAQRVVVLSSLDVYRAYDRVMRLESGPPERTPLAEGAPLRTNPFPRRRMSPDPSDVMWSYDKIPVERIALSEPRHLPATVLRLPAVYGPGDYKRRRVGLWLDRMKENKTTLALDETFSRWRWTRGYIDDVIDAIVIASTDATAAARTYNVGETAPLTEGDWVRAIARVAGYAGTIVEKKRAELPAEMVRELEEQDYTQDLVMDTRRIRSELEWSPRVPLDEGLAKSIAWARLRP